jgi:tRNA pseudouridine32 synthase/23S rRNA pseudouridine746 synthase
MDSGKKNEYFLNRYIQRYPFGIDTREMPLRFPYPHYYTPHPLAIKAAELLQEALVGKGSISIPTHILESNELKETGKMFGVMPVKDALGNTGFIMAFSGKIGNQVDLPPFAPPLFNRLETNGFFLPEEEEISAINRQIVALENNEEYLSLLRKREDHERNSGFTLTELRNKNSLAREKRKLQRVVSNSLPEEERLVQLRKLDRESQEMDLAFRQISRQLREERAALDAYIARFELQISEYKARRRERSSSLQQRLFEQYFALNARGEERSLQSLFQEFRGSNPPSGAGECAAPKLLQFAFEHGLQPLAMAEFWWGPSPAIEIRHQGMYYPACRNKCEPILHHMLEGLETDINPLLNDQSARDIEIRYSDSHLAVLIKPEGMLSVPGKNVRDSVLSSIKKHFPKAEGPIIVHRLDMSTSGLMIVAFNTPTYLNLQRQFASREIEKRYTALLSGIPKANEGCIDLPLRVDLDNRPRQVVCHEHGKSAKTRWKVAAIDSGQTRVYFYPFTGRTHQLRVHAAHAAGLNCPILGDDLYGIHADRLYLHADSLKFRHPATEEVLTFLSPAPF